MAFVRWSVVVAVLLVVRTAGSDCSVPGGSQGYDQCQLYPACQCSAEVISCPGGSWYTQYTVDRTRCVGGGSGGSGSGSAPKSTPCDMMNKWLSEEMKFLSGYEDDDLLNIAISRGWRPGEYNEMLWRSVHPTQSLPTGGGAVMWTDPRDCKIYNYAAGCAWLRGQGLPQAACTIALAHERVHEAQCNANHGASYDPTDLRAYRDREVEAHQHTIADIQQWIQASCR